MQHAPDPPTGGLAVSVSEVRNGVVVVTARGDIDIDTAATFRRALDEARCGPATTIVVDLAEVGFVDSTGFGQLVSVVSTASAASGPSAPSALSPVSGAGQPRVVIAANCRPIVRNAMRLMGLDKVVRVHAYGDPALWPGVTDTSGNG